MRERADILVAGAGPAGLALALQAHDHGAVVRVVDRRPEAVRPSRALIVHARTFEVLRPLGVTQALLARSACELQALLDQAGLGAQITGLVWSSRVTVQHRLASRFRRGPLFLAGEATHAYSPATGQGLNAAIQDAANLGWKLAFADGDGPLLDSYDRERRPVARRLLALTHLVFWAEAATGMIPSALRGRLAPLAAPLLPALRRLSPPGRRGNPAGVAAEHELP